jgi:hypothetical protein
MGSGSLKGRVNAFCGSGEIFLKKEGAEGVKPVFKA